MVVFGLVVVFGVVDPLIVFESWSEKYEFVRPASATQKITVYKRYFNYA